MITKKQIPSTLKHFERFCKIDLQHGEGTAYRRLLDIRRFLLWANGKEISRDVIRSYLEKFSSKSPHTYKRVLCSLRIFFNDYLQREDLIKTFRTLTNSTYIQPISKVHVTCCLKIQHTRFFVLSA
jgi:hypothetical protein